MNEIESIENRIALLPKGSITKKVIQGKDRYYLQWREGDKVRSRYVKEGELPGLSAQIAERKGLQQRLVELQVASVERSLAQELSAAEFLMGSFAAEKRSSYNVEPYESQDRMANFFLSLGLGFCLEARAKQLPVNGPDLCVDWVFYNRMLHCHVLVNLKDGEFRKADLDQLGICIRHYRDKVMQAGDNPPVGILLTTSRGPKMVEFATCVAKSDFASVYKPKLPTKHQLLDFMEKSDLLKGERV
ncbi:MAG: DUF1016 domain-containing protein [Fibrobacter sp.]|nr:DUF1016 domain-containing protein [Fibrobacter sp.]